MKIEIRSRISGAVVFALDAGSLRAALEIAVGQDANLSRANLSRANLSRADISLANLSGADLSGADLSGAKLSGADLSGANLSGANLSGANLSGADLSGANLSGANLSWADLSGANLLGADLPWADLYWANLSWADSIIDGGSPDGWRAVAWQKDGAVIVNVGCHTKTLLAARAYWTGKDNWREIVAFLDYAERVATIRGWLAPESSSAICDEASAGA